MTNGFISGFFPSQGAIAPAASPGNGGMVAGGALGLFETLLGLATESIGRAVTGDGADLAVATPAPGPSAAPGVEAGQLAMPPADPEALFVELVDALAALSDRLATGTPVDPALEADVTQKLEALAAALGLSLQAPDAESVVAQFRAGVTSGSLGPAPAAVPAPPATIEASGPGGSDFGKPIGTEAEVPARDGLAAAPTALLAPNGQSAPMPATAATVAPAAEDNGVSERAAEQRPLPAVATQLVEKIGELAAALEPKAPGLAKRLAALAEKLGSGALDAGMLAKLGIPADGEVPEAGLDAAIQRLLTANREVKGTPAPQAFTQASLALPDAMAAVPRDKTTAPGPSTPISADARKAAAEPALERDSKLAPETRSADQSKAVETDPPRRSAATVAVQSATSASDGQQPQPASAGAAATIATTTTAVAAEARAVHAAYAAPVRQINLPQVAFEIARHVQAGASRFQIRLDPPELGRVDVKLDVDASGNVNARMTVERIETLDLMQRDQRALERALAQAGLDGSRTNLEFSLRQNPFAHQEQQHRHGQGRPTFAARTGLDDAAAGAASAAAAVAYRGTAAPGGINLFV